MPPTFCDRRRDAESFGDVVDHEADDEERSESELAERERAPDRQPFAEVVDADAERDEQCERHPSDVLASRAQPRREERHAEVAERDPEQDEPGAARAGRQRRLQLERLEQRLDAEEGEQPGGECHEGSEPCGLARRSDGSQSRPSATGTTPTRKPMIP